MSEALQRPTLASYAMVASLVMVWGTTFYCVKLAVAEVPAPTVAAARVWLAAAVLVPFAILTRRALPQGRAQWVSCFAVGFFSLALPVTLITWAQQVVPSGVAGIYMAAIPLFVLPLAHFFSAGEAMTVRKLIGFLIGFAGILILIGWETLSQLGSADGLAQLACLGSAVSYAIGSITIRNAPKMDTIALSAVTLVIAGILMIPLAVDQWPTTVPAPPTLAILAWIGAVSTGIAMVLRVKVISSVGSVFMSVAGYFVPIVAMIVGAVFASEVIQTEDILACAMIIGGVAFAQFAGRRASKPASRAT